MNNKVVTVLVGLSLVLWGVMALFGSLLEPIFHINLPWLNMVNYWPLAVIAVGDGLLFLALQSFRNRGFAPVFIPALPVLTTGGILLAASVFDSWHIWSFAWSLIPLALALGFVVAGVMMRNVWFGIPAILIGMNSLVLAFCAFTGLWSWWAFLWAVEPLSLGLVFLLIASQTHSKALVILGGLFCLMAGIIVPSMLGIVVAGSWGARLVLPFVLIAMGALALGWSFFGRRGAAMLR